MTSICTLVMMSGTATRHLTLSYRFVPGLQKSSFDLLRSTTNKSFVRDPSTRHTKSSTQRSFLSASFAPHLNGDICTLNATEIIAKKGRNNLIFNI